MIYSWTILQAKKLHPTTPELPNAFAELTQESRESEWIYLTRVSGFKGRTNEGEDESLSNVSFGLMIVFIL